MTRLLIRSLLCLLLAAGDAAFLSAQPAIERDIVFGTGGDTKLKLDLCRPTAGTKPYPVVVCIHGGAWMSGNRTDFHESLRNLASNGYFAATVQYRLAPRDPWPAQIEDVKCAIRFLRSKAKDWDLDPDRFASLGGSAGGHLALMAGFVPEGFEGKGGHAEFSSKVRCVVNYFGPTDFVTFKSTPAGDLMLSLGVGRNSDGVLAALLGTKDRTAAIYKEASPITYMSKTSPPILTFQGTADELVPDVQARTFHAALDKAGVPNRLELLEKAGHGWGSPTRERTEKIRLEFLNRYLKK